MKKKRKEFIVAVNAKTLNIKISEFKSLTQSFVLLLSNKFIFSKSKTSADELALNINILINFNHRNTIEIQKNS